MADIAVHVENLGKRYRIGARQAGYKTLREAIASGVQAPVRNLKRLRSMKRFDDQGEEDVIWALRDINFDINRGEAVGIIGPNGAGKSTLLKILSHITEPTTGLVEIHGRVSSLLEVGTGFHPELSGRENVYLNGTILGMRKKEIDRKFDEIVEFSGVGKFLDTPVKRYSSGMQVRLAFAVAAHLEPEILIVDEVLAVGDAAFQKKCLGKMSDVAKEGRTILFVSHNMGAINQLCERAVLLDQGQLALDGDPEEVTASYLAGTRQNSTIDSRAFTGSLKNRITFNSLTVNSAGASGSAVVSPSSPVEIRVSGSALETIPDFRMSFSVFKGGVRLLTLHDVERPCPLEKGGFESYVEIPEFLLRPGEYSLAIGGYRDGGSDWLWGVDLAFFHVNEEWSPNYQAANSGLINLSHSGGRVSRLSEGALVE